MTLFYESDIAAIGGKIELERKLKSRIGYDLYIVTIKLGNIEAPALMKVYHKGQGKIIDLLKKSDEPASENCPLIGLDNCIITPHIAWAPKEMRQLVIDRLAENLQAWLDGRMLNRVDR